MVSSPRPRGGKLARSWSRRITSTKWTRRSGEGMMRFRTFAVIALIGLAAPLEAKQTPKALYEDAAARERMVRDGDRKATLQQLRGAVALYEAVVRHHPRSGYCDNALWQGANLALT